MTLDLSTTPREASCSVIVDQHGMDSIVCVCVAFILLQFGRVVCFLSFRVQLCFVFLVEGVYFCVGFLFVFLRENLKFDGEEDLKGFGEGKNINKIYLELKFLNNNKSLRAKKKKFFHISSPTEALPIRKLNSNQKRRQ